jgi:hypothetical protein
MWSFNIWESAFRNAIEFELNFFLNFSLNLFCDCHCTRYDCNTRQDGNSGRGSEMNKVKLVKGITKLYFVGALAGSATHIISASHHLGGEGIEAAVTPLMIDGIAIIGMVMRSEEFSKRTNKIGFVVQCIMGALSLTMNVLAGVFAKSVFGIMFGAALVALFIFAEWLGDQIEGREVDERAAQAAIAAELVRQAEEAARLAAAAIAWKANCSHPKTCETEVQCTTKTTAAQKARKTASRKARQSKLQEKALESLLEPVVEPGVRVLKVA